MYFLNFMTWYCIGNSQSTCTCIFIQLFLWMFSPVPISSSSSTSIRLAFTRCSSYSLTSTHIGLLFILFMICSFFMQWFLASSIVISWCYDWGSLVIVMLYSSHVILSIFVNSKVKRAWSFTICESWPLFFCGFLETSDNLLLFMFNLFWDLLRIQNYIMSILKVLRFVWCDLWTKIIYRSLFRNWFAASSSVLKDVIYHKLLFHLPFQRGFRDIK